MLSYLHAINVCIYNVLYTTYINRRPLLSLGCRMQNIKFLGDLNNELKKQSSSSLMPNDRSLTVRNDYWTKTPWI